MFKGAEKKGKVYCTQSYTKKETKRKKNIRKIINFKFKLLLCPLLTDKNAERLPRIRMTAKTHGGLKCRSTVWWPDDVRKQWVPGMWLKH